jgi:hypothetical protein
MNMKKYLFTILAVMAMLAMQVGTAAAAFGHIVLVRVRHTYKGPVFVFSVDGQFSKEELKGLVQVYGGGEYKLYCNQVNETIVKCTTSRKVSAVNVVVSWAGSTFWAFVPKAPASKAPPQYCYGVWDWSPGLTTWANYGTYCQDSPANYGDPITLDNPVWGPAQPYEFMPGSPIGGISCPLLPYQPGDGYYYSGC